MVEVKDMSTPDRTCKIYQVHSDDDEFPDSFLVSLTWGPLTVHTRLFSSLALAENKASELLSANTISDDMLSGDL